ncbi:MAG: SLBB domain-containing protein [Nitrospirae bacterium]|nr:SLBB domain-containing protein [Nitrospirota bacterium]
MPAFSEVKTISISSGLQNTVMPEEKTTLEPESKALRQEEGPEVVELEEELSQFEQYISGVKNASTISTDLRQFGYKLFAKPPSSFAPVETVPVGPNYVLGIGDEIKIAVWGNVEGLWSVFVDRDGNITLPRIGTFGVTGLTFNELKELIYKEFSKYYTGFQMNVSMGSLRTIRVYVMGNARMPGAYTVSALSTLVNALFEAGGPSKTGTMRRIELKRGGKTISEFDMYEFLLNGDKTKDVRLLPEDVIFIPVVGQLVAVSGNVRNPAIYEIKTESRLSDVLEMAGGLICVAFNGRVQVQRIKDHQFKTILEGDLIGLEAHPEKNLILKDGDLIKVFSVTEAKDTVFVTGAVANEGEYGIIPGVTRLSNVISLTGGLLYYASEQAELTRLNVTPNGPQIEVFVIDLLRALKGDTEHDLSLEMNDYIFIRAVPGWGLYKTVSIAGEVRFPGEYTIRKGERLSSIIKRAGGFTEKAYLKGTEFIRQSVKQFQQERLNEIAERLERELLSVETSQVATAFSADEAKILQSEAEQKMRFISALRTIKAKGRIALKVSEPDVLMQTPYDIELEEDDSIYVPRDPLTVQVVGAVYNQSAFIYDKGKDYRYYISLAGGYTKNAEKSSIYILKADGTATRPGGGFFGIFEDIEAGDTIVIPERLQRIAWMRNIRDITQILYQIAVSAGVLIVVF